MYTNLMIPPFRDEVENFVDPRDLQKDLKDFYSNYAVVMSAAKHPTWMHKIITPARIS